jgi:hypothetical protein
MLRGRTGARVHHGEKSLRRRLSPAACGGAGSLVHTSPLFTRLPLADRLSAAPLVAALLEHALDPAAYAAYDRVSAKALFLGAGMSPRLYWCAPGAGGHERLGRRPQ